MGRGTTVIEAALRGANAGGMRHQPAERDARAAAVVSADDGRGRSAGSRRSICRRAVSCPRELEVFYHPETLREICALREYLLARDRSGSLDGVDRWIRMVAVNRLTGHSPGFFSVYTLPPNQAASAAAQAKINARRKQVPPRRDVRALIAGEDAIAAHRLRRRRHGPRCCARRTGRRCSTRPARSTPQLKANSVSLVVTSPPFLDVVDYAGDNWLRGWFCGIDTSAVEISMHRKVTDWQAAMTSVFRELARVLRPGRPRGVRGGRSPRRQGEARRSRAALRRRRRASNRCSSSSTRSSSPRRRTAGASATTRRERTRTGLSFFGNRNSEQEIRI